MAVTPIAQILGGVSSTTQINNIINALNILLPGLFQSAQAVANANLTLSTTETDISGATVTVNPAGANAFAVVVGVFDVDCTAAGAAVAQGRLSIDGSTQTAEAHGTMISTSRSTVTQVWLPPLAFGSHTLKLRGLKTAAAGTATIWATHTTITVILVDLP